LWVLDYRDEIECDMHAIYNIQAWEDLDGPKYLRLAARLPYYQGSVRGLIEAGGHEANGNDDYEPEKRTMSMAEAVGKANPLDALNSETLKYTGEALFEHQVIEIPKE
jgi:hypothetical protein